MTGRDAIAVFVWIGLVLGGFFYMDRYKAIPGSIGSTAAAWPTSSSIPHVEGRPLLILFAHPQCPCTRASIRELEKIVALCAGRLEVNVQFLVPSDEPTWQETPLWPSAAGIPGVRVAADWNGIEAKRFNVQTSGHTLVFDVDRRLIFSGGITNARGHAGDNPGREAVTCLVHGDDCKVHQTPIFGCPLFNEPSP